MEDKNLVYQQFEKIREALNESGYTVLLCIQPGNSEKGDPPTIAGTVTFRGPPEDPQDVEFRTVEQMAHDAGVTAAGGRA
ncbi:MAG: hypothetical protein K9L28_00210 [Synergistales bacterium]|nr:hypothetical protein [Synergistales bacterium]